MTDPKTYERFGVFRGAELLAVRNLATECAQLIAKRYAEKDWVGQLTVAPVRVALVPLDD
jgi:hypothetical protein